jgi:hypothetical protein
MYFYAKERGGNGIKYATSGLLFVITILMIMGMVGYIPFLLKVLSGGPITF